MATVSPAKALSPEPPTLEPPAPAPKDLLDANQQVGLIATHRATIPLHLVSLHSAKDAADPTAIRRAVAPLETTKALLTLAIATVNARLAHAGEEKARLEDAVATARKSIDSLDAVIEKAVHQADLLDQSAAGVLTQLPRGMTPTSPEETRRMARELSPPGLCDDLEMQSPESKSCPLDPSQRETLRQDVADRLDAIANSWRTAANQTYVDESLRPLLEDNGLNPVAALLLDAMTGFIAGKMTAWAGSKIDEKNAHLAKLAVLVAQAPLTQNVLPADAAPVLSKESASQLVGLGRKLADKGMLAAMSGGASASATDVAIQLADFASRWQLRARREVRQLIDPSLVQLADGLRGAAFDVGYFSARIKRLVDEFRKVDRIGQLDPAGRQPIQLAFVTFPSRPARLAMLRPLLPPTPDVMGPKDVIVGLVKLAQGGECYDFEGWVDSSMIDSARARQPFIGRIADDSGHWLTRPSSSDWLAHEDVTMFDRPQDKDTPQ